MFAPNVPAANEAAATASSKRQLSKYLDALAAGRRPGKLSASPEDVELLRTAVALRSSRPDGARPAFRRGTPPGADGSRRSPRPKRSCRSIVPRAQRGRAAVVSIAAGVALVGGSVAVTEAMQPGSLAPAAIGGAPRGELHTGSFETIGNRVMGQIVAYKRQPLLGVHDRGYPELRRQGHLHIAGQERIHRRRRRFSTPRWDGCVVEDHPCQRSGLRGAKLTTSSGAVVAAATLA